MRMRKKYRQKEWKILFWLFCFYLLLFRFFIIQFFVLKNLKTSLETQIEVQKYLFFCCFFTRKNENEKLDSLQGQNMKSTKQNYSKVGKNMKKNYVKKKVCQCDFVILCSTCMIRYKKFVCICGLKWFVFNKSFVTIFGLFWRQFNLLFS